MNNLNYLLKVNVNFSYFTCIHTISPLLLTVTNVKYNTSRYRSFIPREDKLIRRMKLVKLIRFTSPTTRITQCKNKITSEA